jgi:hypothetical protein
VLVVACATMILQVAGLGTKAGLQALHLDRSKDRLLLALSKNDSAEDIEAILSSTGATQRKEVADAVLVEMHGETIIRRSALFIACANRVPSVVELLLAASADVNAGRFDEGTTPMHLAAGWLHSEAIVDLLLAAPFGDISVSLRAKPVRGGLRNRTPVFWSRHYGHLATRQKLLSFMEKCGWTYKESNDEFELRDTVTLGTLVGDW